MTEEATKPKRLRNAKEIEAAYKAGFADGYEARDADARILKEQEARRDGVMASGLERLRAELTGQPAPAKRGRKARGTGGDPKPATDPGANAVS